MCKEFKSKFLTTMHQRGFFNQCTDLDRLDDLLSSEQVTAYAGFDATADSLHIGHLVTLMTLRHLAADGHKVIALVGGATSRVGDPSFRASSRQMLDHKTIDHNLAGISTNIKSVLRDFPEQVSFMDNWEWLGGVGFLEFMRDVGAHFTVSRMLSMDSVKSRLSENNPLSALEFSYMMLQAADFAELARRHGCRLQVGGSDQWGNIVNGIDLARRMDGAELFGMTTKLLTTQDGRKMGKTADGAIWLSGERLSPFEFWQFWRNTGDHDVERFLLLFSELSTDEVVRMVSSQENINEAKVALANAVTTLVHGYEAAIDAERRSVAIFAGSATEPTHVFRASDGAVGLLDVLVMTSLVRTKGEARRLISQRGVKVDDLVVRDEKMVIRDGSLCAISVGKRKRVLVSVE
jgi:tyrosyl-tRNA synthetase